METLREAEPGYRLQMEVKFLDRIPGTGKRVYQFTAIDDFARIQVSKIQDACNQCTAIQFQNAVRKRLPFRILILQTGDGAEFQSRFHWHRYAYIRTRTPHLNGKVERYEVYYNHLRAY